MFTGLELIPDLMQKVGEMEAVKAAAMEAAKEIAATAQATAPVGPTGRYKAGIRAEATAHGARVFASAPESAWVEFGVPHYGIPARWNLRRAAAARGYTLK